MERYDSNSEYYRNYEYEKDIYDAILIEILKVIPRKMRYIGILLQGVASFFYMVFFRMLIPYEKWLDGNKIACPYVTVLLFAGFFLWHRLIIKQFDVDEQEVQCAS